MVDDSSMRTGTVSILVVGWNHFFVVVFAYSICSLAPTTVVVILVIVDKFHKVVVRNPVVVDNHPKSIVVVPVEMVEPVQRNTLVDVATIVPMSYTQQELAT